MSSTYTHFSLATAQPVGMALTIPHSMSPAMIRRLHTLAEHRCAYLIELHQSGRWRRYYTADELAVLMREAALVAERLQQMVEADASRPAQGPNVIPLFARAS
ncbi:MAG TPA: hypothetical protein VNR11_08815 [Xanthobacteraceae bacterium]|nr:hypothetical protein [Xanthobacteraceae bacterium]